MNSILFVACILLPSTLAYLFPIEPRGPLPGTPSPPGSPWPLPASYRPSTDLVTISSKSDFQYISNVADCEPLVWAFEKYNYDFLFRASLTPDENYPVLSKVHVNISTDASVNQCSAFPKFSSDSENEAYNLTIRRDGAEAIALVEAKTVWGGLRGLETFTQLLFERDDLFPAEHFYANVTEISDFPRFPHRGFMLDTARHYYPEKTILQILDAMFYNKFNVFHWHIVDDQSFPFVSKRFPDLSVKGAYHHLAIYTPEMVNRTMQAARLRGIRVILEFDTPGHTNAMGRGHPEILTPCYGEGPNSPGTPNYPHHAPYENLDPTSETTYDFIRELFAEIVEVSHDEYLHLGMDEVYYPCWESSPVIAEFMKSNGYENMSQVQAHYTARHLDIVRDLGAKSIIWQDPLDAGVVLEPDVIIQIWKDWGETWPNYTQGALDAGHQVIISAPWYINYISYGQTWRNYYEIDPILDLPEINPEQRDLVLGGEVCLWSEYADETNVIPRLFPFSSAVAERLWSPINSSSTDDAMWRLDQHRCRMIWRGISAQPILNGYCGSWEIDA